jgi:hypothetical protein
MAKRKRKGMMKTIGFKVDEFPNRWLKAGGCAAEARAGAMIKSSWRQLLGF